MGQEKIGKVAAETDKTQIESSDIAKAAPQSIESFLREPLDALPGMVDVASSACQRSHIGTSKNSKVNVDESDVHVHDDHNSNK